MSLWQSGGRAASLGLMPLFPGRLGGQGLSQSRWGPALPVSAEMAILSCFPVGGEKGFFWKTGWKTTGPPLEMGKLKSDGAGTRKSTARLNSEGRAVSARPGVYGSCPMWTGHCGSQSPCLPPKALATPTYRAISTTHSNGTCVMGAHRPKHDLQPWGSRAARAPGELQAALGSPESNTNKTCWPCQGGHFWSNCNSARL